MKRTLTWNDKVDVNISSDESSSSDADACVAVNAKDDANFSTASMAIDQSVPEKPPEGAIIESAKMYQEYMKHVPIPARRGSVIPCTSWMGLGWSMKQLYGQPLHYLTNILLRQWDRSRFGTEDEDKPLDFIIDPRKAEANVWLVEEVHRLMTSHHHIAKLWVSDPMHHTLIDPIFPKL